MASEKVTSIGSGSSSDQPTPPNVTPDTTASGVENVEPGSSLVSNISPPMSTKISSMTLPFQEGLGAALEPIQEVLNEGADIAMLPSPPINTPLSFSPAPSVYKGARNRGLSSIGDRLLQLKIEDLSSDNASTSARSATQSMVGGDIDAEAEVGSQSSPSKFESLNALVSNTSAFPHLSPTIGAIPLEMGSPVENPRLTEYMNFQSKDLPVFDHNAKGSTSTVAAAGAVRTNSDLSIKSEYSAKDDLAHQGEGVAEKSNWAEEVEEAAERIFMQMEQLASDEAVRDCKWR